MVGNDVPKSNTSDKKLVLDSIIMKRLNMVMIIIMFYRCDKYGRNSNVSKVISLFVEHILICNSSTVLHCVSL